MAISPQSSYCHWDVILIMTSSQHPALAALFLITTSFTISWPRPPLRTDGRTPYHI